MNYTKGKWKAIEHDQPPYHWRIETEKNILAGVYSEANAHLIAAAPDMYEALKLLIERFNTMEKRYSYPMSLDLPRVWAERALAKAEGK